MSCHCCYNAYIQIKIGYNKCGKDPTYMVKHCYNSGLAEEAFVNSIVTYITYSSDPNYNALSIGPVNSMVNVITFGAGTMTIDTEKLSGDYSNTSNVTTSILFTGNVGTFTDTNGTTWTITVTGSEYTITNDVSDLVFNSEDGGSIYEL